MKRLHLPHSANESLSLYSDKMLSLTDLATRLLEDRIVIQSVCSDSYATDVLIFDKHSVPCVYMTLVRQSLPEDNLGIDTDDYVLVINI